MKNKYQIPYKNQRNLKFRILEEEQKCAKQQQQQQQ